MSLPQWYDKEISLMQMPTPYLQKLFLDSDAFLDKTVESYPFTIKLKMFNKVSTQKGAFCYQ